MCILGDLLFTPIIKDKMEHVSLSAKAAPANGFVAEFGVAGGGSLKVIADALNPRVVYGFDSFEGLPEAWIRSDVHTFPKGSFGQAGPLVPPRENIKIVVGKIEQTLPIFLSENPGSFGFLHIDVDLGNVTAEILRIAGPRLEAGTVIRFDEFCDWGGYNLRYPEWPKHEYKALVDWMESSGRRVKPLSRDSFEGASFAVL